MYLHEKKLREDAAAMKAAKKARLKQEEEAFLQTQAQKNPSLAEKKAVIEAEKKKARSLLRSLENEERRIEAVETKDRVQVLHPRPETKDVPPKVGIFV